MVSFSSGNILWISYDACSRLEDGTVNFNDIIALNHGFDTVERVGGGMHCISQRVFSLARYTFLRLRELRHHSGARVAEIYHNGNFDRISEQGGVVTFNLKRSDSSFVGYSLVEKVMSSFKVHLRTGCFCNTGACQKYLGLNAQDLLDNFHVSANTLIPHEITIRELVFRLGMCAGITWTWSRAYQLARSECPSGICPSRLMLMPFCKLFAMSSWKTPVMFHGI